MRQSDGFLTTDWSLVRKAHDSGALERLLSHYWTPIYAYVRAKGHGPDDAADITQSFVATVLLGRGLFEQAEQERGSFRAFLLTCLRNHLTDAVRQKAKIRQFSTALDLSAIRVDVDHDDPEDAFHLEWSRQIMNEALEKVRQVCLAADQGAHWRAFELKVLGPIRGGAEMTNEQIAAETGLEAEAISQRVQTVKRKMQGILREILLASVGDERDIEVEFEKVLQSLKS